MACKDEEKKRHSFRQTFPTNVTFTYVVNNNLGIEL